MSQATGEENRNTTGEDKGPTALLSQAQFGLLAISLE